MKVSVIIPSYNEGEILLNCIKSLQKQTYKNIEIIVVDDGSTDHTLDLLSKEEDIIVLKQLHNGPASARNAGAEMARGEILVFVDADMTFHKRFIEKLIEPIGKGKTIGTFSKEEYVSNWDNKIARLWNINYDLPNKMRLKIDYPNEQLVFRAILKKNFEKVGGFDEGGYTDDWSLSKKLGKKAISAAGAEFYHRNPESISDVYYSSKWSAKREYKHGVIGFMVSLFRNSMLSALGVGIYKSIFYKEPSFLIFKFVFNFAATVGILEYYLTRNGKK